ncbi:MAG: type II secretion system ATPase GspE [Azonexus sp.]
MNQETRDSLRLPYAFARQQHILILGNSDGKTDVLVDESTPITAIAEVQRLAAPLRVTRTESADFVRRLEAHYAWQDNDAAAAVDALGQDVDVARLMEEVSESSDLLDGDNDAPIIRTINALLNQAVRDGASDIHIEPFESASVVRLRIDGILRDIAHPHPGLHAALISRIKIMASLDIAEKRLPQDGRIALRIGAKAIDVRVSTLPVSRGERAVLRLLDKDRGRMQLDALGLSAPSQVIFDQLLNQPHGIVLVTGPTGSGKTTTLYAALSRLPRDELNIMTVEDPIEYELSGISQTQAHSRIGMDFARALRAILRQDPDVVMIGEIRDQETAQIAVQGSLTGHLVLATLHTNDAPSAVTRLIDMGIEPFLLASSLSGVLAQRLVRKLCLHCRRQDENGRWLAVGCAKCNGSGYLGRTGIYELLTVTPRLATCIHDGGAESELRRIAHEDGMISMSSDAARWIEAGITTAEEVARATRD